MREKSMREKLISGVDEYEEVIPPQVQQEIPKTESPHWEMNRSASNQYGTTSDIAMRNKFGVAEKPKSRKFVSKAETAPMPFPSPEEILQTVFPDLFAPTETPAPKKSQLKAEEKADVDKQSEAGLGRLRPERLKTWESPRDLRDFQYG